LPSTTNARTLVAEKTIGEADQQQQAALETSR
jgi:hypothetical protein